MQEHSEQNQGQNIVSVRLGRGFTITPDLKSIVGETSDTYILKPVPFRIEESGLLGQVRLAKDKEILSKVAEGFAIFPAGNMPLRTIANETGIAVPPEELPISIEVRINDLTEAQINSLRGQVVYGARLFTGDEAVDDRTLIDSGRSHLDFFRWREIGREKPGGLFLPQGQPELFDNLIFFIDRRIPSLKEVVEQAANGFFAQEYIFDAAGRPTTEPFTKMEAAEQAIRDLLKEGMDPFDLAARLAREATTLPNIKDILDYRASELTRWASVFSVIAEEIISNELEATQPDLVKEQNQRNQRADDLQNS